ncbi:glycosyltransferase family 4 protein [Acinetobacter lwoffii]|uniref:glycosyltransferase family 4 protein n=1 Tax=Acinetobacter lwoffii TaxID=28090 RepID=UPI00209AA0AE|nr:glycosyltransferase family 4 protein [Acinetobacter lwoffii]MCO8097225.1 glycosyltransferase family 4 protein [Acinetobacter lwoffii]
MKKILIIQEYFPIYRQAFFDEIAKEHNLTVLVSKKPFFDINAEKRLYVQELGQIKEILKGKFFWSKKLLNYNFKEFDVVVLSAAPRNLSFLILMFYLKFLNIKTVFWGQHWSFTSTQFGYTIRMLLLKLADSILFYTDKECENYRKTFLGRNDKRIITGLNNGLDVKKINEYRTGFLFQERMFNIFFIGRLSSKTNLMLLIEAIRNSKYSAKIKLHIIGEGELKDKCISAVKKLGLSEQIIFYGSIKEEEKIAKIANQCSLFVYTGAVGLSLIHAMAYGLPCIVHKDYKAHGPEVSALIESGGGDFYEKNNLVSLTHLLDLYLINRDLLEEFSRNNIQLISQSYNALDMSKRFNIMIGNIISD